MFDKDDELWEIEQLKKKLQPYLDLQKASEAGYFWSIGTHPEWGFDARIWKRHNDFPKRKGWEVYIGIGKSVKEAVDNLSRKLNKTG